MSIHPRIATTGAEGHGPRRPLARRPVMIAATFIFAAALPVLAQHPAVASSVLLDPNRKPLGFDAAGNLLENGDFNGAVVNKVAPDGTLVSQVALLQMVQAAAFDASGNLYVFNPTCVSACPAPTTTFGTGTSGALFGKVNSAGDGFVWLDKLTDAGPAVMRVDAAGNVYLAGNADCSFAATSGAFQTQCAPNGSFPAFAAKVDSTGTKLLYATFLRGTTRNQESIFSMAVDESGSAYVTGEATPDWPTTTGAFETTANCPGTACPNFVAKLSADGSALAYSTFLNEGVPFSVAVDSQGSAYVGGQTSDPSFPTTPRAAGTTFPSWPPPVAGATPYPGFVMKFRPDGTGLVYSTYVYLLDSSTSNLISPPSLIVDSAGDAYLYGLTLRPGVATVNAIQAIDNHPDKGEGAIAELNPQGSGYVFSTYLGGPAGAATDNAVRFVAPASDGLLHIAGFTVGNEFPALTSTINAYFYNPMPYTMALQPKGSAAVPILFNAGSPGGYLGALQDSLGQACAASSCGSTPTSTQGTVYLGNYGAATLDVGSIAATGDFSQTNDCPASLAAGAQCTITVTFKPTTLGNRSGSMTLTGGGLSQTMGLMGLGAASQMQPSASALYFGVQAVGTSSPPQTLTINNTGNFSMQFSAISVQGQFSQTNGCGIAVAAGAGCAVQVTFTPTASAQQNGTLTLASNAINSPIVIQLEGGVNPDFSMAPAQGGTTSQTITAGQTATYNLALTPIGGFSGTVSLSCSGAPSGASCSASPLSVNLSGAAATPFTVSVSTTARGMIGGPMRVPPGPPPLGRPGSPWLWAMCMFATGLWLISWKRRFPTAVGLLGAVALFGVLITAGCGGGSSSGKAPAGTPAGTYTITVSAKSSSATHTQDLTLTVQ